MAGTGLVGLLVDRLVMIDRWVIEWARREVVARTGLVELLVDQSVMIDRWVIKWALDSTACRPLASARLLAAYFAGWNVRRSLLAFRFDCISRRWFVRPSVC